MKKNNIPRLAAMACVASLALLLTACGGGGGSTAATTGTGVTASTTNSGSLATPQYAAGSQELAASPN